MTLNELYSNNPTTAEKQAVRDFVFQYLITNHGLFWYTLHVEGKAEEFVQELYNLKSQSEMTR